MNQINVANSPFYFNIFTKKTKIVRALIFFQKLIFMKSHPSHKLYGVDVKELEGEEDLYAACFTLFHFNGHTCL